MDRREQLDKAVLDRTAVGSSALLPLEVARKFLVALKDSTDLAARMTLDIKKSETGQLNKFNTSNRIIRAATENTDDGYRVGANFPTVPYTTKKIRLPWEVTEDVFHENIGGEGLEQTITGEMTKQFSLDLEDLDVNGDESDASAFLQINEGLLPQLVTDGTHRIDGSTINAGVLAKEHFFAAAKELPSKYWKQGNLVWLMSPARHIHWYEILTARATSAGDQALIVQGPPADKPLGREVLEVPSFDDTRIVLTDPKYLHRVVSWEVRRRRVTGETDAQLAATDKRFYVFHIKEDFIIEEHDAIVDIHTLDAL